MGFRKRQHRSAWRRLATLCGVLLALAVSAFAERFSIKTYGVPDGLGSSFIINLLQDSRGFLWFCTRDGLSRFDGNRFTTYKTRDGLPVPTINAMLENPDGTFWVATNGGGVCRFDPAGRAQATANPQGSALFTSYLLGKTPNTNRANLVYRSRAGVIYVGTDEGLFCLQQTVAGEGFQPLPLRVADGARPQQPPINGLLEDRHGTIWITSPEDALYRVGSDGAARRYTAQQHPAFRRLLSLFLDRDERLWVGTSAGLCLLYDKQEADALAGSPAGGEAATLTDGLQMRLYTTKDGLIANEVTRIAQSRDGHLWLGTENGVSEFDGARFRSYGRANGLTGMDITRILEDRDGNLWFGTRSTGVMKFARRGFIAYDERDAARLNDIHNLFEDAAGNLFAVSDSWYVHQLTAAGVVATQRLRLPDNTEMGWMSNAVWRDSRGEWWAVSNGSGVFRFAPTRHFSGLGHASPLAVYTTRNGLPHDYIRRVFEDSRGNMWFQVSSISAAQIICWERADGRFHRYTPADGLPAETSWSAAHEDRDGNLWLGFDNGSVYRFREGRFLRYAAAANTPIGAVTALLVDRQRRLWIADNETGVTRIDEIEREAAQAIKYSTAEGLSSDNARCLSEDRWGRLYVGTVRGVDRLDTTSGRIQHFSSADGLSSDFTKLMYVDRRGDLWVGTLSGLSKFTPEPPTVTPPPVVIISGLRIAGEAQAINELGETAVNNLEIETGRHQVQIDFTAPAFGLGETLRFQYRLEGADTDWGAPTELRTVHYANLAAGSYRFVVRAINGEGISSPAPATVAFRILPPIWRRGWFLALVALFLGGIAAVILQLRRARRHERERAAAALHQAKEERLRELEQVRRRIAADLHDDIGSNLTRISLLSEVAQRQLADNRLASAGDDGAPVKTQLSSIARLSRELVDSMSDIVWAINPQKDHLGDLSQKMRLFAGDLLTARDIELQFAAANLDLDIKVGANLRREFFLIFKEGVNNIARHAACSRVEIEFGVADEQLRLRLSDNGRGFDTRAPSTGHGLASMRERALALDGALHIESGRQGTTLRLAIPLAGRRGEKE